MVIMLGIIYSVLVYYIYRSLAVLMVVRMKKGGKYVKKSTLFYILCRSTVSVK